MTATGMPGESEGADRGAIDESPPHPKDRYDSVADAFAAVAVIAALCMAMVFWLLGR